ncbi:hypothetical protein HMPREF1982_02644 [Clostridiales bacterium oral taxon 876 str. F0540]|nr:hypothetical protein HMPREF1982_02644 [Clostridiales bacterium oral taxon 876 str. F0540]
MKLLKKHLNRRILNVFTFGIIILVIVNAINIAYACYVVNPDVTVNINSNGKVTQQGSIFNEFFYPGKSESGIIRINNKTSKSIEINNLGLSVDLVKFPSGYNKDFIYSSFLDNMNLNIQRGKIAYIMYSVIAYTPLRNFLYKENDRNYKGLNLGTKKFTVGKGDFVDLKYTMTMDIKAKEELEDLKANLEFKINGGNTCN